MIYILTHEFAMLEQTEGLMQNMSLQTPIEFVTSDKIPQKDSGIVLMPLEKIKFAANCGEKVFARCTKLDGTLVNLSVIQMKTPVSCGHCRDSAKHHVGEVFYTASSRPPEGSLKADGSEISRECYSRLFDEIGVLYGEGDGSTTFNVPDLRGEFIRGFDDGRKVDLDRAMGSWQDFCMENHNHGLPTGTEGAGDVWTLPDELWSLRYCNPIPTLNPDTWAVTYPESTVGTFGKETRPRNIALLACIQYK